MIKHIGITTIFLFSFYFAEGQTRPIIFLENLDESNLEVKCYCKPGVRNKSRSKGIEFSYNLIGPGELAIPNGEISPPLPRYSKFRKFRVKLGYPLIRGEKFNMLLGFSHHGEKFSFNIIPGDHERLLVGLDNLSLKASSLSTMMLYSWNEKNYLGLRFNADYHGNYSGLINFSDRYSIYNTTLVFGIKKTEDKEWGIGLTGATSFRNRTLRVLPFIFWNATISDRVGIEATLPVKLYFRYNVDAETIFLFGANYNGESYSFEQDLSNRNVTFNHSEIQYLAKAQKQVVPWLWVNLEVGYQANFNSNFQEQATRTNLLDIDPRSSYFFRVGLFISPPDSFR